jgi:hypothetical protein
VWVTNVCNIYALAIHFQHFKRGYHNKHPVFCSVQRHVHKECCQTKFPSQLHEMAATSRKKSLTRTLTESWWRHPLSFFRDKTDGQTRFLNCDQCKAHQAHVAVNLPYDTFSPFWSCIPSTVGKLCGEIRSASPQPFQLITELNTLSLWQ